MPALSGADGPLGAFTALRIDGDRLLVRRGREPLAAAIFDPPPGAIVGHLAGGREPHPVVALEGGERVLVRRYRRGGLLRHLNPDRYFRPGRAFREVAATELAARSGVRVPTVLAAIERPARFGYTAAIATLLLEGADPLSLRLDGLDAERRRSVLHRVGTEIARLHQAGITHPDLNLDNVLLLDGDGEPDVYLIDFDRARVLGRPLAPAARRHALDRLARSARKLGVPLPPPDLAALHAGYRASTAARG